MSLLGSSVNKGEKRVGAATPRLHDRSARARTSYGLYEPSLTSTISSATLPCASRWTASAASALGASNRQKTSPFSSLNQYIRAFASWLSWASRSFLWSSATASAVSPSRFLWWSIYRGIAPPLLLTPSLAGSAPNPTISRKGGERNSCYEYPGEGIRRGEEFPRMSLLGHS